MYLPKISMSLRYSLILCENIGIILDPKWGDLAMIRL